MNKDSVHEYLMPDYCPDFSCKIGTCRHACCEGWPVSISLKDYYRLLGENVSTGLRRKIDSSLHTVRYPTQEEYAEISPSYTGECPLRAGDGRCLLHAELGESALADVCRLYPRGVRANGIYQYSCSNSCERVIEMFLDRPAPLRFIRRRSDIVPPPQPPELSPERARLTEEVMLYSIGFVQDRSRPLPERLMTLAVAAGDIDRYIAGEGRGTPPGRNAGYVPEAGPVTAGTLLTGIRAAREMLAVIDRDSRSIHDYGEYALGVFRDGADLPDRYRAACRAFAGVIPDHGTVFEHMLVNHMFFSQFPMQDRPMNTREETIALCCAYALLRFLCLGWVPSHPTREAFVDVCAAAFRMAAHTRFDSYAVGLLRGLGFSQPEDLYGLIRL